MLNKLKPRSLPLQVNICLFITLFAFSLLYILLVHSPSGTVFHVLSGIIALLGIIPLVSFVAEMDGNPLPSKRKPASTDVQQKVDKLCLLMGIKKKLAVKVVDEYVSAGTRHATIFLGKPLLDKLDKFDGASINAVLAHELAHIKKRHNCKLILKIIGAVILFAAYCWYSFIERPIPESAPNTFIFIVLLFLMLIVVFRVVEWPYEFEADTVGARYVTENTMVATLQAFAQLKGTDVEQDFYLHPSISRRIANLKRK